MLSMKPAIAGLALALVLSGCSSDSGQSPGVRAATPSAPSGRSPSPAFTSASGSPPASPAVAGFLPSPDQPIPRDARTLANALQRATTELHRSIDQWTHEGNPSTGAAPDVVVLQALYQQRIYRFLARHRILADRTFPLLPGRLRREARANIMAAVELFSIVRPISRPSRFRTGAPKPAGVLLGWFRKAERRFRVDWELLAAVMYVESKFGRVRSTSTAGAQGPMQFIPSTWAAYGMGGDIHDPHDSIMGAANYLHRSGAPSHERQALFAYNHSGAYVNAVLRYANQMRRDPRNFYTYYNWQVFVLTTSGDRRLTGPGL
jgi:soluble lytic murein transglycosylase-like protein